MIYKAHHLVVLCLSLILFVTQPGVAATAPALPAGDDARVTRVVSGDTIEVVIKGIGFTIGYLGADAPNTATSKTTAECYAARALAMNRRLVVGQTLRVERDVSDFDTNGRLWRYVYLMDGRMVNEELLSSGNVRFARVTPDRRYDERLSKAEKTAQTAKKGLWGACAPVASPAVAALPASSACVTLDYATFAVHGPRPAALANLPEGACVTLQLSGQSGTFIWKPAGSRIRLDRDLYVRWADGTVPITQGTDGKWRAFICAIRMHDTSYGPMTEPAWEDREVVRGGSYSQILMLPVINTFVLEEASNGEFVALVDVLQYAAGTFVRWYPQRERGEEWAGCYRGN